VSHSESFDGQSAIVCVRELVVGREGQGLLRAHPRAPGQCLHFECCGGLLPVSGCGDARVAPLPHHFVCVEKFTLPYLFLIYFTHTH